MGKPKITSDGRTISVRVPISIKKRGGRKVVLTPHGGPREPEQLVCRQVDNAVAKAIARAFRWSEMLESGLHTTIREIAVAENINESYIARILRLTLLAPNIVESILRGDHSATITLAMLMRPFPPIWVDQISEMSKAPSNTQFRPVEIAMTRTR